MTYKTKCKADGSCIDRIDSQAESINKLRDESLKKTEALIKASKQIAQLEAEKAELTGALNRAAYNPREDANWDSRPRERGRGRDMSLKEDYQLYYEQDGIRGVSKENFKKQVRMFNLDGQQILEVTLDEWETVEYQVVNGHVTYAKAKSLESDSQ